MAVTVAMATVLDDITYVMAYLIALMAGVNSVVVNDARLIMKTQ